MNTSYEIPLEASQSALLTLPSMRASFFEDSCLGSESSPMIKPIFRDIQWKGKSESPAGNENEPLYYSSLLSTVSPLDALPLNLTCFADIWPPMTIEGLAMDVDDEHPSDSLTISRERSPLTLRERRLLPKSPQLGSLQIHVPPVRSEYLLASAVLVGSSDFIVWLDKTVSTLYCSSSAAAEARKYLLAVANDPTEKGFQLVYSILQDPSLIEQFTDKLATHMIHFNEESSDGLRSAWSDSTCSELSDYDISPSYVAMDVLRSIDDAIDESSLISDLDQWPLVLDSILQERDITELHNFSWL